MDIEKEELIWFPVDSAYESRKTVDYDQPIENMPLEDIIELVQKRAQEDGEFCIENDMVGPNKESEPKMRLMMAFVSDPKNIEQAVDYIYKEGTAGERTVDFVCRDLANASKWAANVKKG
jgi:hypothetical protein